MNKYYIQAIDADYKPVWLSIYTAGTGHPDFRNFKSMAAREYVFYFYNLKAIRSYIRKFFKHFPERVQSSYKIRVYR